MKKSLFILVVLALLATACNLPGSGGTETQESPDAVYTHAAETMNAELTRVASQASPTSDIPTNTNTPIPSNTPMSTATKTPIPCLLVGYSDATIDVTVPDYTTMAPGQAFTKTWRLTNAGTCTWNSSYQLVFDHGDGMGVTSTYSQPLTSGTVAPGQTVDVSVNLTAPAVAGTYTGYWRFRDPNGVYFGIGGSGAWVVLIKVVNTTTVTLLPVIGESGSVRSDNAVTTTEYLVGDASYDKGIQLFVVYNIASIPATATITEVKLDMRNSNLFGDPFATLGILNLFLHDFHPLDGSDYVASLPGGNLADWGTAVSLGTVEVSDELKTALQAKVGTSRIQFRFQFQVGTDSDGAVDALQYLPSGGVLNNPALIVKYTTP